ncbi:hypothetical protein TI05_07765 [Achromatium sp. WMS3]|nr:hypothetical protein TI05_07765 [Achromatium sp. WMS3]
MYRCLHRFNNISNIILSIGFGILFSILGGWYVSGAYAASGVTNLNVLSVRINAPDTRISDSAVQINYRYSKAGGNGKKWALENGSTLHTKDRFSIKLRANRSVYVYLIYINAENTVAEFIKMSGYNNYMPAGTKLLLPAKRKNFTLIPPTGLETIHTIVSLKPLPNLVARYRRAIERGEDVRDIVAPGNRYVGQNVRIEADPSPEEPPGFHDKPSKVGMERVVNCDQNSISCREAFVIKHLPRRR